MSWPDWRASASRICPALKTASVSRPSPRCCRWRRLTACPSRLCSPRRRTTRNNALCFGQAYGVALAALFAPPAEEQPSCVVLRAGSLPPQQDNGLTYTPLSRPEHAATMQPIRVVVPARREDGEMYRHDGEEWLFVVSGTLRLALAGEAHTLGPGDTAHFDARVPHRLSALHGVDAELILVACAAPRLLLDSYL